MDADKEGFLRSETSLIQTVGELQEKRWICHYVCKVTDQ